jgi:hypothetical protein
MTDQDKNTIAELAEVIAEQSERIRNLLSEMDEQNDIIVAYELDQENEEKTNAALYNDLSAALEQAREVEDDDSAELLEEILEKYFGDFE